MPNYDISISEKVTCFCVQAMQKERLYAPGHQLSQLQRSAGDHWPRQDHSVLLQYPPALSLPKSGPITNCTATTPPAALQTWASGPSGNVGAANTQYTQISRQNVPRVPNTQPAQAYRNGIVPRMPNSNQASNMQGVVRRTSSLAVQWRIRVLHDQDRTGQGHLWVSLVVLRLWCDDLWPVSHSLVCR